MTAVEDGEILEVDHDEVIDLCSDGSPSPRLVRESQPDAPVSHVNSSPPLVRQNIYTGGDPFLAGRLHRSHTDDHSVAFPSPTLDHGSAPFTTPPIKMATVNNVQIPFYPPVSSDKPMFQRDPYTSDSTAPSVLPQTAPDSPNIAMPPISFPIPSPVNPSNNSRVPHLPPRPTRVIVWPHVASSDSVGKAFAAFAASQSLDRKEYGNDQDRYSPNGDQELFSQPPVYHTEPAPPPSPYVMQHSLVAPMNAGPDTHTSTFEVTRRRTARTVYQPQERSTAVVNHRVYVQKVARDKDIHLTGHIMNPSDGFADVGVPYREVQEIESQQRTAAEEDMREEAVLQNCPEDKDIPSAANPRSTAGYPGQLFLRTPRRRPVAEDLVADHVVYDEAVVDRSAPPVEESLGHFSNENRVMDCGASQDIGDRHRPANFDNENMYPIRTNAGKTQHLSPTLCDEPSEGEIHSPRSTSPVISVATAPDETPSPPSSAKKKPANFNAKKHLLELRKKALMSVKKRPSARREVESVDPTSSTAMLSPVDVVRPETVKEHQNGHMEQVDRKQGGNDPSAPSPRRPSNSNEEGTSGSTIQMDSSLQRAIGGVPRTMTHTEFAEWQAWPFQNRVLVEYSSDSSDSSACDESDDDVEDDININTTDIPCQVRSAPHQNREKEIEAMKIRMVRLGKCPSMLFGVANQANGIKSSATSRSVTDPAHEEPVPSSSTTDAVENSVLVPDYKESPVTVRHVDLQRQFSNTEQTPSPKSSQGSALKTCSMRRAESPNPITTDRNENESQAATTAQRESPTSSPSEVLGSSALQKSSDQALRNTPGKARAVLANESNTCPKLTQNYDTGNEESAKVRSSGSTFVNGKNPIAELKRRIEAIEKSRDLLRQQRKKQKTVGNPIASENSRKTPETEPKHEGQDSGGELEVVRRYSVPIAGKGERKGVESDKTQLRKYYSRSSKRYYASGLPFEAEQNRSVLREGDGKNEQVDVRTEVTEPTPGAEKESTWNGKFDTNGALQLPGDNAEQRYIDDLKLELQQKTKELLDERDRMEQLRTAEVAIAEAQAKLNFTRSRVSALRDELRKAQQNVIDAEKEHQQRARVIAQLRFAGADISGDAVSGQDDQTVQSKLRQEQDSGVPVGIPDCFSVDGHEEDMGIEEEEKEREEQEEQEEEEQEEDGMNDFVLRPSPYSPSVGDRFTSCLRAFRAYAAVTHVT